MLVRWRIHKKKEKKRNRRIATALHAMHSLLLMPCLTASNHKPPPMQPKPPSRQSAKSLKFQTIPHALPHTLLELGRIVPPEPRGLDVCRTLVIRARQHGDDAEQDRLWRLDGRPALGGGFVAVFVLFRGV